MEVGGYNREPDWSKMGGSLVIASSLVLAIRTSKWKTEINCESASERDLEKEIEYSIKLARGIMSHLVSKSPSIFPSKNVPWYQPSDDESPE